MRDYGLFTWEPGLFSGPIIIHWKEDLPYVVLFGVYVLLSGVYVYWKDRRFRRELEAESHSLTRKD